VHAPRPVSASENVDRIEGAPEYLAHVDRRASRVDPLGEHLRRVSNSAAGFGASFGASDWAHLAGRWHDLGKFQEAFQAYIRRASGYDADDGPTGGGPGRVDHSTPGAIHAVEHLGALGPKGRAVGRLLAYVIAGHHAGLPDWSAADGGRASLEARLTNRRAEYAATAQVPAARQWMDAGPPGGGPPNGKCTALWLRMLFSALVDADFLDTEAFMDPATAQKRTGWLPLPDIMTAFDAFMTAVPRTDTALNRVRSEVLKWCREAAKQHPGVFSLTVPTGGGKTLSSMAFALNHASRHGKRRIVYVIPYTSIIEQTADVFRRAFGDLAGRTVLEHHSNLDDDKATSRSKLAAENWDAPVVVTTSIQFFESLFSARTSKVRKLHNLVDSVVVLDEVQLLPVDFLRPVLDAIQMLADHFGATVLLMTATQPAWNGAPEENARVVGLRDVREIVPNPDALHHRLRRVEVAAPEDLAAQRSWEDIANALMDCPCALCVVNTRRDARVLFETLAASDPDAVHLSALMCGAHRSAVIADMRARLRAGAAVRVVSTQLVEAGVDIDFPVVFRALAGLDSIAQAAGRCNREGKLDRGEVWVFVPPSMPPPGILRKAEGVTRTLLAEGLDDLLAPDAFRRFFRQLYWLHGENLDKYGIRLLLDHAGKSRDLAYAFRTAAERFRIIRDDQNLPVIVRWEGHPRADRVEQAIAAFEYGTPDRWAFRALQRSIVNVPRWSLDRLLSAGAVEQIHERMFVQIDTTLYDERVGLRLEPAAIRDPEEVMA
jgi:CRISPR-associated endonuclease/helicase Cas3